MTFSAAVTLTMMLAIIILLFKNIAPPGVIFTLCPIIACFIMGYSPREINEFIGSGMKSLSGTIFLMIFAILYFGILHEAGVFKALVKFVMRFLGNSILGTLLVAAMVSIATQLDGSGATTALCTIPAMKPVFDRQRIRPEALLLVESLASGIFCLLPWAPGFVEGCSYLGIDVYEVFVFIRPLLIFSTILLAIYCIPIAIVEKRNGAGLNREEFAQMKKEMDKPLELPFGKGVAVFDGVFTLALMALLLTGRLPSNMAFGLGLCILMLLNFRESKAKQQYIRSQASTVFSMVFTLAGVAVLVGVNSGTGALTELAQAVSQNASSGILMHVPFILCLISMLLSITIGGSKNSVVLPAIVPLVTPLGFTPEQVFGCVFAAGIISANLNLFNAAPYLALGLAGVEMKNHLKYSLLPVYGFSLIMVAFMVLTGMMPV